MNPYVDRFSDAIVVNAAVGAFNDVLESDTVEVIRYSFVKPLPNEKCTAVFASWAVIWLRD